MHLQRIELSRPLKESRIHFKKSAEGGNGSESAFGTTLGIWGVLLVRAVFAAAAGRAETAGVGAFETAGGRATTAGVVFPLVPTTDQAPPLATAAATVYKMTVRQSSFAQWAGHTFGGGPAAAFFAADAIVSFVACFRRSSSS